MSWVVPFGLHPVMKPGTCANRKQESQAGTRPASALSDGYGDGHRRAPAVERREAPGKGRRAGAFRIPPLGGVSPRKLPSGRRRPSSRPQRRRGPRRLSSLRR